MRKGDPVWVVNGFVPAPSGPAIQLRQCVLEATALGPVKPILINAFPSPQQKFVIAAPRRTVLLRVDDGSCDAEGLGAISGDWCPESESVARVNPGRWPGEVVLFSAADWGHKLVHIVPRFSVDYARYAGPRFALDCEPGWPENLCGVAFVPFLFADARRSARLIEAWMRAHPRGGSSSVSFQCRLVPERPVSASNIPSTDSASQK